MNVAEVMAKADTGEGLTVDEIKVYQANVRPIHHVYGKYGTLAKMYLEGKGTLWTVQDIPTLLHGIDNAAEQLYDVLYAKLSQNPLYKRTGEFMEDYLRLTALQHAIEEEILHELIYIEVAA